MRHRTTQDDIELSMPSAMADHVPPERAICLPDKHDGEARSLIPNDVAHPLAWDNILFRRGDWRWSLMT